MAWTKNLGRVKGETGDVYIPSVELDKDGYLSFTWKSKDTGEVVINKKIRLPVYVPKKYEDGNIEFTATGPVADPTTNLPMQSVFSYHIKGDTGEPGVVQFDIAYPETSDPTTVEQPKTNTFYISGKKVWIYKTEDANSYVYMEYFDLQNYYTISETYSMEQIDEMLQSIEAQVELIQKLYDIDESLNN